MKISITMFTIVLLPVFSFCQQQPAQIIFNGGYITITNNANLVVQNPQPAALTLLNGGGIISEGANNNLVWNVANNNNYIVPFFTADKSAIPLSFTTQNANGAGTFTLSTYAGSPDWNNANYLPPGVANVNRNGSDNSDRVIDRFWKIDAEGFTAKPSLSNLKFSYQDVEWNESGNTINELSLAAQRWNDVENKWSDFVPTGVDDATNNAVTLASVNASDLYKWWTLVDLSYALPVQLISFNATAHNAHVLLDWKTASEINTSYFTVEKTKDFRNIVSAGTVPAAGNSAAIQHYSLEDKTPFTGISYYRLKTTDKDGRYSYSQWVKVDIGASSSWLIYPNPATDKIYVAGNVSSPNIQMQLINASGVIIKQQVINNQTTEIPVSNLAAGSYIIRINDRNNISTFKIIKR